MSDSNRFRKVFTKIGTIPDKKNTADPIKKNLQYFKKISVIAHS